MPMKRRWGKRLLVRGSLPPPQPHRLTLVRSRGRHCQRREAPLPLPPPVFTATPTVAALAQIFTDELVMAGSDSSIPTDGLWLTLTLSLSPSLDPCVLVLSYRMEVKIPTILLLVDPKVLTYKGSQVFYLKPSWMLYLLQRLLLRDRARK